MSLKLRHIVRKQLLSITCLFFSCLTFSSFLHAGNATSQTITSLNKTDRIIIKYKNNINANSSNVLASTAAQAASSRAGIKLTHVRRMHSGAHIMKLKQYRDVTELNSILLNLNADPNIEFAEPDLLLKPLFTPNDPRYNEQWHYFENAAGLNLPAAWDITQGTGAVVAVLDTGYRPHIDLVANVLDGYDMISDTSISQDGDLRDNDATDPGDWAPFGACGTGSPSSTSSWHGTHVAGTIAAVGNNGSGVSGVAFKTKIVPVRVLGRCGGYTSDIADGIIWAAGGTISGTTPNQNPADVINLSLGGFGSCGLTQQNAINTARNLGATVIVAAGNENTDAINSNPANCSGVVSVAAVNREGGRAFYSNFGSVVDVAAPGGDTRISSNGILSTLNNGTTTSGSDIYAFYQGTSMATPHVAGVAALMYSVNPAITPDEVELILKNTSRAFTASCNQCGAGLIDAYAAVIAAGGTTTPPPATNSLSNGISESGLSGVTGDIKNYTFEVPAGASNLVFALSGGTGDADLYVKFGSEPDTATYDCRPYLTGNNETCTISNIQAGTYHVMLRAYAAYNNTSLTASYTEPASGGGWSQTGLSGLTGQWRSYTLDVPVGMSTLNIEMLNGTGDADLYVRYAAAPTTSSYDCRPYNVGNNENCDFLNPQAGRWYISIRAYSSYSGVNLNASFLP